MSAYQNALHTTTTQATANTDMTTPSPRPDAAAAQASELTAGMLRIGSQGSAVTHAQGLLNQQGADLANDGIFGPLTHQATVQFQATAGLMADGIIGPQTWGALDDGAHKTPPQAKPPQDKPPQTVNSLSPLQPVAAAQLPGLIASPGVQASPVGGVFKSVSGQAIEGDAQTPPPLDTDRQAKSVAELSAALDRIVARQEPYPGPEAPKSINQAKNMSADPTKTPAQTDWLYDFLQAIGVFGLANEWHRRTESGEQLDGSRASIVSLALGEVGKVEARNSGGGAAQPVPGGGQAVVWRKGAADFDRIFSQAGAVVDDGHSGAGTATRQNIYDSSQAVGKGQPVPSWCGIFALAMHKYAGRTGANWAGHAAPWAGQTYGPEKYQAVNIFQEFPKPGDIAYQEKGKSPAGGQHHGIVIQVTPTDPSNPLKGFKVMTVDGNFTTISSIIVHEEDRTWWDGFFRAAPKGQ